MRDAWKYLIAAIETHPFNFCTLVLALAAAAFAGWSAFEAHRTRIDAEKDASAVASNVKLSADASDRSAKSAEASVQTLNEALTFYKRAERKTLEVDKVKLKAEVILAETNKAKSEASISVAETSVSPKDFVTQKQQPTLVLKLSNVGQIAANSVTLFIDAGLSKQGAQAFTPIYDNVRNDQSDRLDTGPIARGHNTIGLFR